MRCTLKDIAKATGLSISTVSHALKNKNDISQKTKERVKDAALTMGYVPDSVASGLRDGKSNLIGILQDDLLNPYFSIMSDYINNILSEHGYHMLIFTQKSSKVTNDVLTEIITRGVDGLISFIEISDNPEDYTVIEKNHFPVVVLGRRSKIKCVDNVYSDDKKGGYIATKFLLDCGCRNLIYASDNADITSVKDRQKGFIKAMEERGYSDSSKRIKNIYDSIEKIIDDTIKDKVDGIICINDIISFEILHQLKKHNMSGIRVIGHDDINAERHFGIHLTSVSTDKQQIAKTAVKYLLDRINDFSISENKVFDVSLNIGET